MSEAAEDVIGHAIFEARKDTYVIGVWYMHNPGGDMLLSAVQNPKGAQTKITTRFRYYVDKKIWGSKDKKSIYEALAPVGETEDETVAKIRFIMSQMESHQEGGSLTELLIKGDSGKLIAELRKQPWAHFKDGPSDN